MDDKTKYEVNRITGWLQGEFGSLFKLVMQITTAQLNPDEFSTAIEALQTTCTDISNDIKTILSLINSSKKSVKA